MTEHAPPAPKKPPADEADVIVVGAGPAGATTAFYLAQSGLDVLLLEKSRFPREKVCGDGLTPRAVKTLVGMGISVTEQDGWVRNKGLRVIGAGKRLELPWPELASYPGYGLVRTRHDMDETLARRAAAGRRAAARGRHGDRPGPRRAHRPDHRRRGQGRATAGRSAPTEPGSWSRRTATPRGSPWPWACASATTGRSASRSGRTTGRTGTTTTTWSPGSTCGTATGCCPATAGSSAWATGPPTSGWGC